nr:monothiol bacilliredoxin BrxC family protein [Paenibacillus ihbetae]
MRTVSYQAAEDLGIRHESPQVQVILVQKERQSGIHPFPYYD